MSEPDDEIVQNGYDSTDHQVSSRHFYDHLRSKLCEY